MTAVPEPRISPADGSDPGQLNVFRTLRRHPDLYRGFLALGGHLLGERSLLPPRERELVVLRTGFRARAEYEFGQHTRIGEGAGLTAPEIARLAGGPGEWDEPDAALVEMVDELCDDDAVSEPTWQRLAARWNDQQLLELLVLTGFYRLVSGLLNSAGVALEEGTPGWPPGVDLRRAPRVG